jgi:FKBP-type peptidyl-prolyl cis-trans isomerase (trigger factor)
MKTDNTNTKPSSPIKKLPDGSLEIEISIPKEKVGVSYQKALAKLAKNVEIKGFRTGKAPISLVEKQIKKENIYEEIIKELVPQAYVDILKQNNIKPIVNPQIQLISADEGKDWQLKAITCEKPQVVLNGYQQSIKNATAGQKIWVPGKEDKNEEAGKNQKLDLVFKTLLDVCQVKIPGLLVEEEVNQMLSRLLGQTEKLGITVEQYLQSVNKTIEQLRHEYHHQAEDTLKLEFILNQIAEEEKVVISDEDVNKMIATVPDEQTKKNLENPKERAYIRQILKKQGVIDRLLAL